MGACTSRHANRSLQRSNEWKVDDVDPAMANIAITSAQAGKLTAAATAKTVKLSDLALNCVTYSSFLRNDCLTGWEDGTIQRLDWRLATTVALNVWKPHSRAVNCVVVRDKLQMIYSCSRDTTVAITPVADKPASETATILRGHQSNVSTVAVDDAEQMLCSGGWDTQTIFWDLTTSHIAVKNTISLNVITCSTWLPGEKIVAQGSEDLSVKFWDPRTPLRVPVQSLRGFVHFPLSIAADGEGTNTYLLTSSKGLNGVGCEARIWDRRTGKQVIEYHGHQQDTTACCFLPQTVNSSGANIENRLIPVTASKDGTVKIWNDARLTPLAEAHAIGDKIMFTSMCRVNDSTILTSTVGGQILAYSFDYNLRTLALLRRQENTT